MKRALLITSLLLIALAQLAAAQEDIVMKAMRDELSRSMSQLRLEKLEKPYFIAYRVDDTYMTNVAATLGELSGSTNTHYRSFNPQVRVGDYKFDNSNFLSATAGSRPVGLPVDDDYDEIRRAMWLATDAQYKAATAEFSAKKSAMERRQGQSELADFIKGTPNTFHQDQVILKPDVPSLEKLAKDISAVFVGSPEIVASGTSVMVVSNYVRFLDSEGTSFTRAEPVIVVSVGAQTLATDGTPLEDSFQVYETSLDKLSGEALQQRTRDMLVRLKALRTAPLVERYNGPVLFEDEAAPQLFAQVFAPALVAGRLPISDEPQFESQVQQVLEQFGASLADRIGGRVLPESFDVIDDPKPTSFEGMTLVGTTVIDDEGTTPQKISIIEGGILQNILATRTPTAQTSATTGNAGPGGPTPSNLYVSSKSGKTNAELRQQLLTLAKKRGYDYGIVVRHAGNTGLSGMTRMAARMMSANASGGNLGVYKVYADGHEELARADIAPLPLAGFKDILAAGNQQVAFNGAFIQIIGSIVSGGRGGSSIISYMVPPLLFEEVSLRKPGGPMPKPPVIASPLMNSTPTALAK